MRRVSALLIAAASLSMAADVNLTERYRTTADKLIDAALADTEGYNRLAYLCYRIGNRLSGSPSLERAIAWSAEQMKEAGLSNVRIIPTKVPHWVRGAESARMLEPLDKPLHMLGLGMSIGTPPGGITADVVTVSDFDDLARLGREKIEGKIVVYNEEYRGYGPTRVYRSIGRVARRGLRGGSRAGALGHAARHADSAHRRNGVRREPAEDPDRRHLSRGCHDDRAAGGRWRTGEGAPRDGRADAARCRQRRRDRRNPRPHPSRRGGGDGRPYRFVGRGPGGAGRRRFHHGLPRGAGANEETRARAASAPSGWRSG